MLPKKELILSQYGKLYDIVVPKDHVLRKFTELMNFEFVYNDLL
jgi:hypothetical protein